MAKLFNQEQHGNPNNPEYCFYCPGCKTHHWFKTTGKEPRWTFNGDMEKPTVRASILVNKGNANPGVPVCHLFITDGKIQYLNDCTHELAGKTIDMQNET